MELEANRVGRKVGGGLRWGGMRYGKLWVTDGRGRRVPAVLREEGRKIWIRIEGRGWEYPLRIDPLVWVEQAAVLPSGLTSGDELGFSVALSGNGEVAIVGAYGTNNDAGAAYVYTYDSSTGTWSTPATLSAPTGAAEFGNSVALSSDGEVALVGAYRTGGVGAAYIYTYDSSTGTWSTPAALSVPSGYAVEFGNSVALSSDGEVAIVGAPDTNSGAGAAYIYTYDSSTENWSTTTTLSAPTTPSRAYSFGASVALSSDGDEALVGAYGTNGDEGAAYVYTYDSSTGWSSTPVTLSASCGGEYCEFGNSVALSGNGEVALVGAVGTNSNVGAAYVYTNSGAGWSSPPTTLFVPGGANFFGISVALSSNGEEALVGARGTNSGAGAAYVYTNSGTGWSSTPATLSVPSGAGGFGNSVALSSDGEVALVGAPGTNSDAGAASFYGEADLDLALDVSSAAAPGGQYTEQAILTNDSGYTSPNLTLNLPIPGGTNYQSSSASSTQGSCTASPSSGVVSSVSCDVGTLAASGGSATASVTLGVPSNATAGTEITETANVANTAPTLSAQSTTVVVIAPTLSGLADETVTVGATVPSESFTIGGTGALTVTVSSSNPTLLPDSGIGGYTGCTAAGSCTLTLSPVSGQVGTTAVTVTVEDDYGQETSASFALTVNPPGAPTITGLTDETAAVGQTVPSETFTIGGTGALTVTASSSNPTLLPDTGIGGYSTCTAAGSCTLTLSPVSGQVGTTTVTVTVENGYGQEGSESFSLTVSPPGAPTLSGLTDETVAVGATVPSETFTIGGTGTLTVTVSSSNPTLLPDTGIGGYSGCTAAGSCALTLSPVSGQVGTTTVTVTVANGYGQEASASFSLTVASSVPAVSGLEDISTTVGSPAMVEDFTVSGVGPLSVETETTNAALLPEAFIEVSPGCGSGSGEVVDRCTLTLSPTAGMTGEASVLVTVTDAGGQTATGLVTLYVEPSLGTTSGGTSGGGSVGVGMLLGLLVLVGLKRRRKLGGRRV